MEHFSNVPQEKKDLHGLMAVAGVEITGAFVGLVGDRLFTGLGIMALGGAMICALIQ